MTTSKILFLYDNQVDDSTLTASSAAITADNLQEMRLGKRWRTTGVTSEWVQATLPSDAVINTVALWGHNMTLEGDVRIRLSNNSDMSSPLYDTTWAAWNSVYGWGDAPWGDFLWGGYPSLDELAQYPAFMLALLDADYEAAYLRLDLTDTTNTDGYLQAGRLIAGSGWQPQNNISYGWSMLDEDPSTQVQSDGGQVWIDKRDTRRILDIPFSSLVRADAMAFVADLGRRVGLSKDLLVVPFPDTEGELMRTAVYGLVVPGSLQAAQETAKGKFTWGLKVRELTA